MVSFSWFVHLCQQLEGQNAATKARALTTAVQSVPSDLLPLLFALLLPDRKGRAVPACVVAHACGAEPAVGDVQAWAAGAWARQGPHPTERLGVPL